MGGGRKDFPTKKTRKIVSSLKTQRVSFICSYILRAYVLLSK